MFGILGKPGWLLVFLAGAFLVPYLLLDERVTATVNKALGRGPKDAAASKDPLDSQVALENVLPLANAGRSSPSAAPLCDMATALSFEVTPQWITATWPRVSTVVGDASHSGMRVPLVTGVMSDDLVGTLSYYFDDEQRLQRITFSGTTGDPRRLIGLATNQFGLAPQATLDAGLYQSKWNGKAISALRVRHASVVSAAATHGKYDVALDLKRADALAGTASASKRRFGW